MWLNQSTFDHQAARLTNLPLCVSVFMHVAFIYLAFQIPRTFSLSECIYMRTNKSVLTWLGQHWDDRNCHV